MLQLDPGMMIWTWITFFTVLILLYKVALKPILSAISDREDSIRTDIEDARRQRDEAEALLEKHRKMVAEADMEAQKMIREAQSLAEKTRAEIVDKAREEATALVEKAKVEIEKQKDDALKSLKAEVVDLALGAAEKVLVQVIDKDMNKKVVDNYLTSMPKSIKN
ncbi:MAG TPA: ATP synthase F0 subunit B [Caldithrix abyssi]|uniref:ATP synthase subunit b n=1 Tax=Caldithrix abyssi TaxID=187145 RepID=A0A7V1LPS8_CALAY|nr:ATP synthase F0 subunit B [Caldithrix abyssi]